MLENIQGDSWGSIPPLRMPSLLPHDLCHEWNASPAPGNIWSFYWKKKDIRHQTNNFYLYFKIFFLFEKKMKFNRFGPLAKKSSSSLELYIYKESGPKGLFRIGQDLPNTCFRIFDTFSWMNQTACPKKSSKCLSSKVSCLSVFSLQSGDHE